MLCGAEQIAIRILLLLLLWCSWICKQFSLCLFLLSVCHKTLQTKQHCVYTRRFRSAEWAINYRESPVRLAPLPVSTDAVRLETPAVSWELSRKCCQQCLKDWTLHPLKWTWLLIKTAIFFSLFLFCSVLLFTLMFSPQRFACANNLY
jgi:hypothetical protein